MQTPSIHQIIENVRRFLSRLNNPKTYIALGVVAAFALFMFLFDILVGTHVAPMTSSKNMPAEAATPTAHPTAEPKNDDTFFAMSAADDDSSILLKTALDSTETQTTTTSTTTLTTTETFDRDIDMLQLARLAHGEEWYNTDRMSISYQTIDDKPARLIKWESAYGSHPFNGADLDKMFDSNAGSGLTFNRSYGDIPTSSGRATITMTAAFDVQLTVLRMVDMEVDGSLTALDSNGNFVASFILPAGGDHSIVDFQINTTGRVFVLRVDDSFVYNAWFKTTESHLKYAFTTASRPASLPNTLGECVTTQADHDMFNKPFCPAQ